MKLDNVQSLKVERNSADIERLKKDMDLLYDRLEALSNGMESLFKVVDESLCLISALNKNKIEKGDLP